VATKAWSSTAPPGEFRPYVQAARVLPEFSFRAVILGAFFGLLFGAVTVYVGLRAGLTVSASIPIAVLSISILRAFGKATILENNIVQTTGSAGESVAAGVIFTLPALIFLGFPLEYWGIFLLALIGGWLGVLFMIPLRRQLIVKEHGNLTYPEGTACADVLVAGDRGGSFAGRVFWGLGLGGLYTMFQNENVFSLWPSNPEYRPASVPGLSVRASTTSEYLGVGYIIGPRVAGILFAGGVFSWWVLMPAIKFFGSRVLEPLYPSTVPISQMTPDQLWGSYVRYIGAGAVAAAGVITLGKTIPTIWAALRAGLGDVRAQRAGTRSEATRTERDLSMKIVVFGSLAIVALMWALLTFRPIPGAKTTLWANVVAAVLVVIFGFLFVTVSSRIVGLIGSSSNPISGMTIATLMATCAMFLLAGWTGGNYAVLALTIGGVVCIAAANAGATSQDLKTGFLVGATPRRQQVGLMIGVMASVLVIGGTVLGMNRGLEKYVATTIRLDVNALPEGVQIQRRDFPYHGKAYYLLNALGSPVVPEGKYLYNPGTQQVEVQWLTGIGSQEAPAPQARLMSVVISGILARKLPWGLVLMGVFLVLAVELLGIRSLPFAVGSYIPIGTTFAIFCGGVVRWLAERGAAKTEHAESEVSPGSLYASGLIAAGALVGLLGVAVRLLEDPKVGWLPEGLVHFGTRFPALHQSSLLAVVMFALLAASLFFFARKRLG